MLSIRFSRTGKKKQPYFRLLVTEKQKDPWGKYLELLGNYNPRTKQAVFKEDRIKYWLSVGAQATVTVHNLLVKLGIIEGKKKNPVKISHDRRAKLDKDKADAQAEKETTKPKGEQEAKTEAPAEQPQPQTPAAPQPVRLTGAGEEQTAAEAEAAPTEPQPHSDEAA